MKFTIKHALVVAIAALCVCVVATGTVVAVTMSNRETEAATASLTLRMENAAGNLVTSGGFWQAGTNVPHAEVTINFNGHFEILLMTGSGEGLLVNRMQFGSSSLGGFGRYIVGTTWLMTHMASNNAQIIARLYYASFSGQFPQRNTLRLVIFGNPSHLVDNTLTIRLTDTPTPPLVFTPGPGDQTFSSSITRVVRSAATGTATTTITSDFEHGFRNIPEPANQLGTFRGWALPGNTGVVIFPRGLPVPIFSNLRLYAVHT